LDFRPFIVWVARGGGYSPVASKSPKLTGSLMVQTASRLVAASSAAPSR
jgi:hypothetical protein